MGKVVTRQHFGDTIFLRLFFAAAVFIFSVFCYEMSIKTHRQEYETLKSRLQQLEDKKTEAFGINAELKLRVNSQSDPAWIELTLIEGLGLCPIGHQKVVFTNEK